jgi:hypothetical protein
MSRAWRIPALVLIPALIVAGVVVQNSHTDTARQTVRLNEMVPAVSPADALSSTWYCAAGTSTGVTSGDGAGFAEQTLEIANSSDVDATGLVTAIPDAGVMASAPILIPAHGRQSVRVSDIVKSAWASALVEVSGGGITVVHELQGPSGRSVDTCASSPGSVWYFPSGTTRAGTRNVLTLFNPFPGEATVDISFDTEDGSRTPQQLQGMVVPGGRVTVIDVSQVVTLREHVSTTVSARVGRIVVEQVQSADGRNGTEQGLTAVLGAATSAPVWSFPVATPASMVTREIVSVFNPGDADTDVLVQVQLDDPQTNGSVEPFHVSVAAHRSAVIDLGTDARIPKAVGRWLIVRSSDGAAIVAERSIGSSRTTGASATGGLTHTIGVPVLATTWFAGFGSGANISTSVLSIANPSATQTATVSLLVHAKGSVTTVASVQSVQVAPGERRLVDVAAVLGGRTDASLEVQSDGPVVVGQWIASSTPLDFFTISSFPLEGTQSLPVDVFSPEQAVKAGLDPSLVPDDTVIPDAVVTTSSTASSSSTASTTTSTP